MDLCIVFLYMTTGIRVSHLRRFIIRIPATQIHDKREVVGYWSIAVTGKETSPLPTGTFTLNTKDKKELLKIVRTTLEQYIRNHTQPEIRAGGFSETLKTPSGCFVTLKEDGALRGCVGRFTAEEPLYKVVQEMAIASATRITGSRCGCNRDQQTGNRDLGTVTHEENKFD